MKYALALRSAFAFVTISLPALADMNGMSGVNSMSGATAKGGGGLSVSATFDPNPPQKGPETITVVVKSAAGKPVKGAMVKIATNMPSMAMAGPTLRARDNGDGTYAAQTNLNYSTKWTFAITATAPGKSGSAMAQAEIK